jgi:D-alanine transaminase
MIVYFNGQFMPGEQVRVSPDDRGFLLADGVYEVVRSYGGRLFKLEEHLARLARSLREIRIPGLDAAAIGDVAKVLIERNGLVQGDATVYIQVTRGAAPRRHAFPEPGTPPTVYLTARAFSPQPEKRQRGVGVALVPDLRWGRCDIKSLALLPNVLASQEAKERGAEEAVFVRQGVITEGAHTNVSVIFDGELVTHPLSNRILAGVTRALALDLCRELGIPARETPVREGELRAAQELMILGTTTEIMPVVQVDGWAVGDGRPGPVTRKLQKAFTDLVAG